jgi:type III secretory pathway component EscS
MSATSPLVFRPSLAQRALAVLLCAGSWLVGVRAMGILVNAVQGLATILHQSLALGEPTSRLWLILVVSLALCFLAGLLLLCATLGLFLIEGTQVVVDEMGVTVDHAGLPRPLARRLGAGHLPWKYVSRMEKGRIFFLLKGGAPPQEPVSELAASLGHTTLKFLMVDELERLVLVIMEKSPNLTFKD